MDPNEARKRCVALAERLVQGNSEDLEWQALFASANELAETFLGLDEWLKKGGFTPSAWVQPARSTTPRPPPQSATDEEQ